MELGGWVFVLFVAATAAFKAGYSFAQTPPDRSKIMAYINSDKRRS